MTTPAGPEPQDRLPARPSDARGRDVPMPVIGETPATGRGPAGGLTRPDREHAPARRTEPTMVAILGDTRREGAWRVPENTVTFSVLGDFHLDLRQAAFDGPVVEFSTTAILGDVTFVVAPGTEVEFRGLSLLGDRKIKDLTEHGVAGVPVTQRVVVKAYGMMNDVTVKIVEPGREIPRWWRSRKRR